MPETQSLLQGLNLAFNRLLNIVNKLQGDTMKKRDKIIYWISTIWLALGMLALLILTALSWYFRPEDRKIILIN
jgi:hypothetical protein